ncbi:hypothetical protein SLA2020_166450 [Shorea laevis]
MLCLSFVFTLLFLAFPISSLAFDCQLNNNDPTAFPTITVDQYGGGNFKTIQSAINFIPQNNIKWIRILIFSGNFLGKVTIPPNKPCIYLQGAGRDKTSIEWNDHSRTDISATFTSYPENIIAKDITFMNTYNIPRKNTEVDQAVAARIYGDKSAFYNCGFIGVQDTLWDATGRHYYNGCYIEGAVDFIWGDAQSIYESCEISLNVGKYAPELPYGCITAQGRNSSDDPSAFVFKQCTFDGFGETLLGRAYGLYSRVIIYDSYLSNIIQPQGWDAWHGKNHIDKLMYVEAENRGPGANTINRVSWLKKLSRSDLRRLIDIYYNNEEEWIAKLPNVL